MICKQILGNLFDEALIHDNEELIGFETVNLTWDECAKRIHRKTTNFNRVIGISLPVQTSLRHGDFLSRDTENKIVVFVEPCEVIVVFAKNSKELGLIAYEFGNRHLPLEVTAEGQIILLPDGPTEELLNRLHVDYEKQIRRFNPIPKGGGHHGHHHHSADSVTTHHHI